VGEWRAASDMPGSEPISEDGRTGTEAMTVRRTNPSRTSERSVWVRGGDSPGIAVEPDHVGLEALARLADEGKLRVHVSHTFPLERAAEAHALLETGQTLGKIVLTP
jgi:NADPH:quinone reductase-like Zn-dependent oxidoreductase